MLTSRDIRVPAIRYLLRTRSGCRMSYASVAARNVNPSTAQSGAKPPPKPHKEPRQNDSNVKPRPRRSPSPAHIPRTESPEKETYVLTLMTDKPHHDRLTKLREQYFPKQINKLAAHLTLFHALPGSKLESDILPVLKQVASSHQPFKVHAARPFRLKRGMAIDVPRNEGGSDAQKVHHSLQQPWKKAGFLSEQDAGGCRLHYTIMNKVEDDAEVDKALREVTDSWKGDQGTVEGLGLFLYERGYWRFKQKFAFGVKS